MAPVWCKYDNHYHDLTDSTRQDVTFLKLYILMPTCLMLTVIAMVLWSQYDQA